MRTRYLKVLVLCFLAAGLLTGCNLPTGGTSKGLETSTIPPTQDLLLLATLTQQARGEETQLPPATLPPTATGTEAPTQPPAAPVEIKFLPGGTIYFIKGHITPAQQIRYTFTATAGQTLIAGISSNDQAAYFEIKDLSDGSILAGFSERASSLTSHLPISGAYQITLTSDMDTVYFLSVEIPAELSIPAGSGIHIIDGRVEVLEEFHPDVPTHVRYLLDLEEGTTLDVRLKSEAIDDLTLALTGVEDGVPYLRYVVKTDAINDFPVMVSQRYYLDVYAVGGETADYTLEIEVGE